MVTTRSGGNSANTSPASSQKSPQRTGSKRKAEAETTPSKSKRGKGNDEKPQKTLEETFTNSNAVDASDSKEESKKPDSEPVKDEVKATETEDTHMQNGHTEHVSDGKTNQDNSSAEKKDKDNVEEEVKEETTASNENRKSNGPNGDGPSEPAAKDEASSKQTSQTEEPSKQESTDKPTTSTEQDNKPDASKSSTAPQSSTEAINPSARSSSTPSSILEKGLIYFFFRGRVGIDTPSAINEIARSYIILRPIPHGASLQPAALPSTSSHHRVLALPKKQLPKSPADKFMVFVEQARVSGAHVRDTLLSATDYTTQTAGTRHSPAATPIAEGVYALTHTGTDSHLAYKLTLPEELSEVQRDIGLQSQGSWVVSAKNPKYPGPANASLPEGPGFPEKVLEEFRGLRWGPVKPEMMDYVNAQMLLIGIPEGGKDLSAAMAQGKEDGKNAEKVAPEEELEKLEGEDELRVEALKGDEAEAIFQDLALSQKDYSGLQKTW